MTSTYAVIMAGGSGTRFWPASRRARPKQLLPLGPGDESLIRATARRIEPLVPPERIYVVTSAALADATAAELPEVPRQNILAEPVGRNTAPCVGWAAAHVGRKDPSGVLIVLPADHHIGDEEGFRATLETGVEAAARGDLVTVGIRPTRPETGYGYLELDEEIAPGVHRARRFVEKPNRQRAEQFLSSGRFLWNSGMFFFRADTILAAIREHLPGLGDGLKQLDEAAAAGNEDATAQAVYPGMPSVSIDHGVMEKAEEVAVVPGSFGWSDLGSWTTAFELTDKDEDANSVRDGLVAIDAKRNYVSTSKRKIVALVGVDDLVIVDTDDALLVVPRDRAQEVRDVVQALKDRGHDGHL